MNENFFNVNLKQTVASEEAVRPETPDPEAQISLFEARKLNEQHISQIKQQRTLLKKREIQAYRVEKNAQVEAIVAQTQEEEFKLRQEVAKYREIKKIIKEEQANELNKNLKVFVNLNQEEKILRQELFDKQEELKFKEKQLKIASVVHKTRIGHLKREEREKFIGNFAQAKNLIENQMRVGYHLKMKRKIQTENKKRVD